VLNPAVFDIRESEISKGMKGIISYELSLSAPPVSPVRVTVTDKNVTIAECAKHGHGLELEHRTFVFDGSNFNVSQIVRISMSRNEEIYQGTSITFFEHTVTTDDLNWATAFLRPVSISVTDDSKCTVGAKKIGDGGARICGCSKNFYVEETDDEFCDSVLQCAECPEGMVCDEQQELSKAKIVAGWYRANNASLDVVECPLPHACVGKTTSGDELCRDGHMGPFCMICQDDYVWSSEQECALCDGELKASLIGGLVATVLLVTAIFGTILHRKTSNARTAGVSSWDMFVSKATTKYKILISFIQILGKMTVLYPFRLPSSFLVFFEYCNVFSLDIQLLPFNCLFEADFHSVLVATTLLPVAFVGCVYALYALQRFRIQRSSVGEGAPELAPLRTRHEIEAVQSKCEFIVILVLISVFPIISTTIFQTFVYDSRLGNGVEYLRADYKIERSDPTHQRYLAYGSVMALLYCVGLPLFALQLLKARKQSIQKLQKAEHARALATISDMKETDPILSGLSPLYKDFCAEFWWFQILLWMFTTFQTGIVILVPAESVSQVALALLVSIVMLVMLANAHPYLNRSDNMLSQCCQFSLMLVQIAGLLQMNECAAQDDWLYGPILIVCTVVSVGFGTALILAELFHAMAPEMFEKIASKLRFTDENISEGLRFAPLRKSIVKKMSFIASVVPVHLNGELSDAQGNGGPQSEAEAESAVAPAPSSSSAPIDGPSTIEEGRPPSAAVTQRLATVSKLGEISDSDGRRFSAWGPLSD
jgi:hypothetical protein